MKDYCVYKHTSPDGKVYIGITNQGIEKRACSGHGYKDNKLFFNDIVLYGWLNFKHEILYEGLSRREAEEYEIESIKLYKSDDVRFGYNQILGVRGYVRPEEVKKRISRSMAKKQIEQYDLDGNYIKTYESSREAERQSGIRQGNIWSCCNNKCKSAGGFVWKYSNQNNIQDIS